MEEVAGGSTNTGSSSIGAPGVWSTKNLTDAFDPGQRLTADQRFLTEQYICSSEI